MERYISTGMDTGKKAADRPVEGVSLGRIYLIVNPVNVARVRAQSYPAVQRQGDVDTLARPLGQGVDKTADRGTAG